MDSNILIRYLSADDAQQTAAARSLLEQGEEQGERFHISTTVLCELIWTLRGRPYHLDRPAITSAIEQLSVTPLFVLQSRELVLKALQDYRQGRADFPDYLNGWQDRQAGCKDTLTFDRELAREEGFTLLG
ncbi:MAG: PIN domain-containing protein [Acidobacteriota bacterium]